LGTNPERVASPKRKEGAVSDKVAIISVDGHVKPARRAYLDYIDPAFRQRLEEAVQQLEGTADGFVHPNLSEDSQWDAARRVRDLESQGVVAEVLFSNGPAFDEARLDHSPDPGLTRASNMAYNRWLIDFCSQAPGRFCGLAAIDFEDVEEAVADVYWAKDNGLGGVLMPPLHPGAKFFFDPALHPIWAACEETGLPLGQHGGTGAPKYEPQSFASFMVLATEHSFFSGRSLWQLILGGVFDRFPDLKIAYIETEQWWLGPVMDLLDRREKLGDDWTEFAETLRRVKPYKRLPSDYWRSNCFIGLSPFAIDQIEIDHFGSANRDEGTGFVLRSDNAMVGVDYPHPETVYPGLLRQVKALVDHPRVTEADVRKVLFENAAELFHFDPALLGPHIERVGFRIDEVPDHGQDAMPMSSIFEVASALVERPGVDV
jgi:predicted TIM-barrel fold metal-dependent hydrolase